jgi:hypothetical protein
MLHHWIWKHISSLKLKLCNTFVLRWRDLPCRQDLFVGASRYRDCTDNFAGVAKWRIWLRSYTRSNHVVMLSNSKEKSVLDVEPKINFGIRTAVLVLLCCQNAGHALLTRYSQGHHHHHHHSIHAFYLQTVLQATTNCNELSKMITSRCLERDLLEYWSCSCWRDYQTHLFRLSRSCRSIRNWWAHSLTRNSVWLQLLRGSTFD